MEKIWISPKIARYANLYKDLVIRDYKENTIRLLELMKSVIKPDALYDDCRKCIEIIVNEYDDLILVKKEKFNQWNTYFGKMDFSYDDWLDSSYSSQNGNPKFNGIFYKEILSILGYNDIRETLYAEIIKKIGVRTCMYCNAEYLPISEGDLWDEHVCRFETDHYMPCSQYPFLGISFFNLFPSCPFCNKSKSNNPLSFYPYTSNKKEKSPFKFEVNDKSLMKYRRTFDYRQLFVEFMGPDALLKEYNDRFHIDKIYEKSFNDEVEEIVWKNDIHSDSYMSQLVKAFKSIFSNAQDAEEFRLKNGFYKDEEDIFKRPLTKMKQDIAKQLGIIK